MPDPVIQAWRTKEEVSRARCELEDCMSQRSQTPSTSIRELQIRDREIGELREQVAMLQQRLEVQERQLDDRNKQIYYQAGQIERQAQTIQIHSNELSKSNNRPSKFEATPCRYPSQFTSQSSLSQPPITRHEASQFPSYSNSTHLPSTNHQGFNHSPQAPSHLSSEPLNIRWGSMNVDRDQYLASQSVARGERSMIAPTQYGRQGSNDQGSPLPLKQMSSVGRREHGGHQDSQFTTPPPRGSHTNIDRMQQQTPNTSSSSSGILIPQPPPITPARTDSAMSKPRSLKDAMVPFKVGSQQEKIANAYHMFFDIVVDFAYKYVNYPSNARDSQMPQDLKTRLLQAASRQTAFGLMSSQQTRYFLVSKIIIQWIDHNVFSSNPFSGLHQDIDQSITTTKAKMSDNTPAVVRHVYLQEIVRQYGQLKSLTNYEDFLNTRIHQRSTELWNMIRPLMHHNNPGDWEHMYMLIQQAHRLAELQVSDLAEHRLFFAKVNDKFELETMINMDEKYRNLRPYDIMAHGGLIRLGAIPKVVCRVTDAKGSEEIKTVTKAGVLLRIQSLETR